MSMMVDGDPNAPIMLVGMAPGRQEIEEDKPFVGGAGWLLWTILKAHGITRADCYIANVIGEWPAKKSGSPSAEQLAKYRPAFDKAVAAFKGRFIVPLGGDALRAVCGVQDGIDAWRGYLVKPSECQPALVTYLEEGTYKTSSKAKGYKKGDARTIRRRDYHTTPIPASVELLLPTLHPAGVLRTGRKTLPAFNADLGRLARALKGKLYAEEAFIESFQPVPTGTGPFVVDVETAPYLRVGMAGRTADGRAVVWTAFLTEALRRFIRSEYLDGRTLVAHNAQFDLAELAKHGLEWTGPVFDTMLAAHLLQPDLYKGLNEVASLYLDRPRWKHKAAEDEEAYNLTDAKVEFQLFEILREELKAEGMLGLFEGTVMPALRVLSGMTKKGMKLHAQRRDEWLAELTTEAGVLLGRWQGLVGNVNPGSPKQMAELFYDRLGFPIKYKKDGGPTTERAALMELQYELGPNHEHAQVLDTLLKIRVNDKLRNSYAKRPIGDDGCVHPYYLPVTKDSDAEDGGKGIAGTGRIQARDPNVMQLPPVARRIVIPHDPANSIVTFDFKQLELRIAAALSGDTQLQEDLEHDVFARIMERLGCDRTRAKNVAYGTIYGGGPAAIQKALRAKGVHITRAEAKTMQDAISTSYPQLWRWRTHVMRTAGSTYLITNPYGRKRHFYNGSGDAPAAVDFLPQSTAADVLWSDLVPLSNAASKLGGHLLTTVHDESVLELPTGGLETTIPSIREILERKRPELGNLSLPVGVKCGPSWGELTPWETKEPQPIAG